MLSLMLPDGIFVFFFFNDTATTEIYTLSLHDALPILTFEGDYNVSPRLSPEGKTLVYVSRNDGRFQRSEEHTSELQSRSDLVCRLLLEKKKKLNTRRYTLNQLAD